MFLTSLYKKFLRRLGRKAFYVIRRITKYSPRWVFKITEPFLVGIGSIFIRRRKDIILENLRSAFGNEKNSEEINDIARDWFRNMSSGMIELIYLIDRPEEIKKIVKIEGRDNLDAALSKGRGVILVSAHFGNFVLMLLRIALDGYKTNYIMRRMKDEEFRGYVYDYCSEHGVQTIYSSPFRECVEQSFKTLRNNELLFMLLDQNHADSSGVFVDFFGKPAATATGPVVFSNRSKTPILPVFIISDGSGGHKIIIEPPVKFEVSSHEESFLKRNTAQLTKIIEGYIRRYPHEWGGWMHLRWKTKMPIS